ncbi:hypothetical protein GQ602_005981 [Ophiocordyceps camponoti-floridani]|uniref:Uncharacterized protein n=1 Tax=Ophiocordyceps camponoti-floridani TaxID=2030778 RepID=A0A8H4VBL1_9HYPO|nr:hypothetical protein GQ602_005981 [Ophiocordyceps camponoti-floridani]
MKRFLFRRTGISGVGSSSSDDDKESRCRQRDALPSASPLPVPIRRRNARGVEPVSPELAALLAGTDIPRQRRRRRTGRRLRDDNGHDHDRGMGPLELLLSPPEHGCRLVRTASVDSIPSLASATSDTLSSLETPGDFSVPRRRPSPVRRSLPWDQGHPLVAVVDASDDDADDERPADEPEMKLPQLQEQHHVHGLRSVFRSNLTASLRALRSAARSFSSGVITDDPPLLVTRSMMLSIDPGVPYTDERRPPLLEEMPSAELRRYLNPTTASIFDKMRYSASIQMQTYKVHRGRTCPTPQRQHAPHHQLRAAGTMRPREMRENPDFIRIAVLEMAMRRAGKLDGQRAGRAKWVLPPRREAGRACEVGGDGVPVRWVGEVG